MTRTSPSSVEGREFRMDKRYFLSSILLGIPIVLFLLTLTLPGPGRPMMLAMNGALVLMTAPFAVYALTSRVWLQNGVLTRRSAFGTKRLPLAEVRRADLRRVSGKAGSREQMTLVGPKTFRVGEQREDWPTLRDAILAELPPDVRPARRA